MARKKLTLAEVRRALRKVRTKLLNGKITKEQFAMERVITPGPKGNMCGTIACIGGHMAILIDPKVIFRAQREDACLSYTGKDADRLMQEAIDVMPNLHPLFYDWAAKPTRKRAAQAITRALDGC